MAAMLKIKRAMLPAEVSNLFTAGRTGGPSTWAAAVAYQWGATVWWATGVTSL